LKWLDFAPPEWPVIQPPLTWIEYFADCSEEVPTPIIGETVKKLNRTWRHRRYLNILFLCVFISLAAKSLQSWLRAPATNLNPSKNNNLALRLAGFLLVWPLPNLTVKNRRFQPITKHCREFRATHMQHDDPFST
jgi:hypothetical protein